MKYIIIIALALIASPAFAQEAPYSEGYYTRLSGSVNGTSDLNSQTNVDTGYGGELAIGRTIYPNLDLELVTGYRENDFSVTKSYRRYSKTFEGELENFYAGLHGVYNVNQVKDNLAGFVPYVEAGLDMNHYETKLDLYGLPLGADDTVLGYIVGAGVSKEIGSGFEVFAGGRLFDNFSDPEFAGIEVDISGAEGRVGLTKRF